jgi:hypothetical protein
MAIGKNGWLGWCFYYLQLNKKEAAGQNKHL